MPGENDTSGAVDRMLDTLNDMIKTANSPDIIEAQTILLRRLALQGNIFNSRLPAPRNITEVGGYINLLSSLGESEMQTQMLSAILGVAGPTPSLGWAGVRAPLSYVQFSNDRPDCPSQRDIPLTFNIRSDFSAAFGAALKALHDKGCTLPILSGILPLPQNVPGQQPPDDVLPYLGRTINIVPSMALNDPVKDPLALSRKTGSTDPFMLAARVLNADTTAADEWDVQICDETKCSTASAIKNNYIPVNAVLAAAAFYPVEATPPTSKKSIEWARFINTSGLVKGVTKLGDELCLIYIPSEITTSVFASRLSWIWDGKIFRQP